MVDIKGIAHFSIAVSDVEKSTAFYRDVVGCRHLTTVGGGTLSFLDAGGVCLILAKQDAPINPVLADHQGVHHSFMVDSDAYQGTLDHLRANDIEVFFEEDRQGGVVNGPRAYFRDPDGTVLEYIDLTGYMGADGGG